MRPVFKIGSHDYSQMVEELKPVRNDLDAEGSGRNLLDGQMHRKRIASKDKWSVSMLRLPNVIVKQLAQDLDADYIKVTLLDPKTDRLLTKTFYCSTVNYGVQRYDRGSGRTVYEGMNFSITER